jgi:ribosomal protein S12 methylthiotransferase
VTIRTSFIVGFPGETEDAFKRLREFVREEQFDRMGVFTYSREENTGAYDLDGQVPERVKRARRAELMETQSEISLRKNRGLIGREVEVLVEGPMAGRATRLRGRTGGQAPEIDGAVFLSGEAEPGEFVRARVDRALSYDLHASVVAGHA